MKGLSHPDARGGGVGTALILRDAGDLANSGDERNEIVQGLNLIFIAIEAVLDMIWRHSRLIHISRMPCDQSANLVRFEITGLSLTWRSPS